MPQKTKLLCFFIVVILEQSGLAPSDPAEAAIVLQLPSGSYSAIVSGAHGGTGVALAEAYDLD